MANAIPQQPSGDFDEWELRLVRLRVKDFLETRSGADLDADDLSQEALIHWWLQRDRYSPARGASRQTFLRRVVDAKLLDVQRERMAKKRGGGDRALSLDMAIAPDSDTTLGDTVADRDRAATPISGTTCIQQWRSSALVRGGSWPRGHRIVQWLQLPSSCKCRATRSTRIASGFAKSSPRLDSTTTFGD